MLCFGCDRADHPNELCVLLLVSTNRAADVPRLGSLFSVSAAAAARGRGWTAPSRRPCDGGILILRLTSHSRGLQQSQREHR